MTDQVAANKRRSTLLVVGFVVGAFAVASLLNLAIGGGTAGLVVAAVAVGALAGALYRKSDVLALAMSHARPADPVVHARLYNLVEGLCAAAGLPMPRVYVIEDEAVNAFATGRGPRHAAVAVTTGLLEKMNRIELEAIVAHELSHVKNHDILASTLAVTMVGLVALVSDVGLRFLRWGGPRHRDEQRGRRGGLGVVVAGIGYVLLAFTPAAGRVMRLAVSRRRETLADLTGVSLTRYPPGLIAALEKLRDDRTVVHSGSHATAHLWIESPVAREDSEGPMAWAGRMFDTHPSLDERIAALREL